MEDIYIIISKYLLGTASPQEEKEIMEWRNADAGHEQEFQELCESWQIAHAGIHPVIPDKERVWGKIMSNLNLVKPVKMYTRRLLYRAVGIAAMLALVLGFSLSLLVSEEEEVGLVSFTAPVGQKAEVSLPDGTKVWLNSGTKLRYPVKFVGNERRVYLRGEAFFEVKKATEWPFIVETEHMHIQVTGTRFNVKSYPEEDIVHTTLVEGAVTVTGPENKIRAFRLLPSQQFSLDKLTGQIEVKEVDTRLYTDWTEGMFVFRKQRLEEVRNTLARWYDIEVFYSGADVRNLRLSANLGRYDHIDTILELIRAMDKVVVDRKGNVITFSWK